MFCFKKHKKTQRRDTGYGIRDTGYGKQDTGSFLLRYGIFSFKKHDTASFVLRYGIFCFKIRDKGRDKKLLHDTASFLLRYGIRNTQYGILSGSLNF